jgi:hypothetical protein
LSYQGRKSGCWHSLPCAYARDGQDLYIILGQPDHKVWWRNLRQPTLVRLRLQGRDLNGTATASSDPEAVAAGLRRYLARYPKAAWPKGSGWRPTAWSWPAAHWSWSPSTSTAISTAHAAAKAVPANRLPRWGSNDPDRSLPVGRR